MNLVLSKLTWRMPVYAVGSAAHFVLLALTILLVIGELWLLCRAKVNMMKVLPAAGFILALMEIFKQLLLTYVRGGSYSWSDAPFQLCSMPMYLMLAYAVVKTRGRQIIATFLMTFGLIGGITALLVPVSVFTDVVLLTVHSAVWHILLVLCGVLCAFYLRMKRSQPLTLRESFHRYRPAGRLYLCLAAAAVLMNVCLRQISGGTCNMFFLGPSWPDLFLLNEIYSRFGWVAETVFFISLTWAAGFTVWLAWNPPGKRK